MCHYYSASILVNQVMENSRSIESLDGYQKRKVTKKPLFQRLLERAQADEERAMRKKVGLIRFLCIASFFVSYFILCYLFLVLKFPFISFVRTTIFFLFLAALSFSHIFLSSYLSLFFYILPCFTLYINLLTTSFNRHKGFLTSSILSYSLKY